MPQLLPNIPLLLHVKEAVKQVRAMCCGASASDRKLVSACWIKFVADIDGERTEHLKKWSKDSDVYLKKL